jgi:GTP-binding protein LepA
MIYPARDGREYELNLIDTPGHVDFAYEVSRSLAACEGALLVIDAAQGVQAQTVANVNLAMRQGLTVVPVINKIDLPSADIPTCLEQVEELLAIPADEVLQVSAKADIGIDDLLEAIVARVPCPAVLVEERLQALIFDSVYDAYRGVITYIRVVAGSVRVGMDVRLFNAGVESEVKEVGFFSPDMRVTDTLATGEVGYLITSLKDPSEVLMGDTITDSTHPCNRPLPGFQEPQPMVFSGIYPVDGRDFDALRLSLSKLRLNDSALSVTQERSAALGAGFRCGFLGLLHMEIVQERLRREYDMDIIVTYPSVVYHVFMKNGDHIRMDNPVLLPDPAEIGRIEEPIINARLIVPVQYVGGVMNLIMEKRGECTHTENVDRHHVMLSAELPLHEIVVDFYDKLKTITRGYGSMDYEVGEYRAGPLVKLEILVNGEPVDAFATIVHEDQAEYRGRNLATRLKEVIPPQMFQIPIQAAVGGRVVARETIRALRKNVTAKCYGGDITRKRKLLEKQKEGKKKMRQFGKVNIPQEAFVAVLRQSDNS